jgi:hypothetical protein
MEALGKIERTIDVLERQVCNCMDNKGKPAKGTRVKVQCLRCELLDILQ